MCVGGVEIVDGSGVQAEQRQWGMARSREKKGGGGGECEKKERPRKKAGRLR